MTDTRPRAEAVKEYAAYLRREEKSPATIEKYTRYIAAFLLRADGGEITREAVVAYKEEISSAYTAAGANGMIAAVNGYLRFAGMPGLCVRPLRVQRGQFLPDERWLDRAELHHLLLEATRKGKCRLALALETIFALGIRIGELRFITLEAALRGGAEVRLKGKSRAILLPAMLRAKLLTYAREAGIRSGPIFVTRGGNPIDRSNLWAEMKRLCAGAQVPASKVFPHNLRRLFARTYYKMSANLAELAGILGHSDINTTRAYIAPSGAECLRRLNMLRLTD